ncbi:hypothetical protein JOM56_013141 [Amanita muscaria]
MLYCGGCGKKSKRSGIYPHCERSCDPRCKAFMAQLRAAESKTPLLAEPEKIACTAVDSTMELLTCNENRDMDQDETILGQEPFDFNEDDKAIEEEEDDIEELEAAAVLAQEEVGIEPARDIPPEATVAVSASSDQMADAVIGRRIHATRLRGGAEPVLEKWPYVAPYPNPAAGTVYSSVEVAENTRYEALVGEALLHNPYAPFTSQLEWEIAKWAKLRGPSSTAFTDLMAIDGVQEQLSLAFKNTRELNKMIDEHLPGQPPFGRHEILVCNEVSEVYFRDIVSCVRSLFADPDFAPYLVFRPEEHYTDATKQERMYHDMHSGDWWWSTQDAIESKKPGATIVPIIISTDKTQLTLFRNKSAYPLYMTIGNRPKEIRRRPSSRAYVLLGYLPTTRLEHVMNKAAKRRMITNLYHTYTVQGPVQIFFRPGPVVAVQVQDPV